MANNDDQVERPKQGERSLPRFDDRPSPESAGRSQPESREKSGREDAANEPGSSLPKYGDGERSDPRRLHIEAGTIGPARAVDPTTNL